MNMRTSFLKISAVAFLMLASLAQAQTGPQTAAAGSAATPAYQPTQANLAAREWFQDAKFGIFLHWGLYSELGGVGSKGLSEWIMYDARMPAGKYERLATFFNPTKFDADEWVATFKAAGANYIVITSKHHDGFAMFDSKVSPYTVVKSTPFAHDPIAELAVACRKQGIKLFFYYSQLDWHSRDYYPRGSTGQFSGRPETGDWEKYLDYQDAQLRELLTQYGPTYALIHSLQPQALIVNNHHQSPFPGEDYQTFERDLPGENAMGFNKGQIGSLPLEMAETMNGTWGFSLTDDQYKSVETLVRTLVGAAGRNANFLLNTGPMPNGQLQPENVATYAEIGQWLKTYGASIYGTRGGPVSPRNWGVTTQKGKTVYVHILDWTDDRLFVPIQQEIKGATLVRDGSRVRFEKVDGGIQLLGIAKPKAVHDEVVSLEME
jgi:alpha-L-fucosidase